MSRAENGEDIKSFYIKSELHADPDVWYLCSLHTDM